jgi:hypothetical protein
MAHQKAAIVASIPYRVVLPSGTAIAPEPVPIGGLSGALAGANQRN